MARLPLLAALAAALLLAGCGTDDAARAPGGTATLLLDFQPSAVHSGIYLADARGFDRGAGIDLEIEVPSSSTNAVRLLLSGRTDLAVLDIHDLAIARQEGRDLVAVMALVQRPLAAVLALPPVTSPRDLEGKRVGVTGLPSDEAVLETVVRGAGGDPNRVRRVTIGFNAVGALLSGEVAGATAFWNVEGLALQRERPGAREFRVDEYGAPSYPELVLTVTRATLQDRPALVRATVEALARGYDRAISDPASTASTMAEAVEGLSRQEVRRQLDAISPAFTQGASTFGELDRGRLREWAQWEAEVGITKRPPNVNLMFDGRYVSRTE